SALFARKARQNGRFSLVVSQKALRNRHQLDSRRLLIESDTSSSCSAVFNKYKECIAKLKSLFLVIGYWLLVIGYGDVRIISDCADRLKPKFQSHRVNIDGQERQILDIVIKQLASSDRSMPRF
ncbi:MAG: hypothetical protein AAGF57_19390, partial [Pseudomonadota bacterium]